MSKGNKPNIVPVAVTLTAVEASTLNEVFNVDAFTSDFSIETAYVATSIKNVLTWDDEYND